MIKKIAYANETEWHEIRKNHVGGSETACLFNSYLHNGRRIYRHLFEGAPAGAVFEGCVSPFKTGVRLWHEKKGNIANKFKDNKNTRRGKRLEEAVAAFAMDEKAQELGEGVTMECLKVPEYYEHPDVPFLGATLDYGLFDRSGAIIAPVECKDVSRWAKWDDDAEPPLHYSLQVQTQSTCSDTPRGYLAAAHFYDDALFWFDLETKKGVVGKILEATQAFADALAAGREPDLSLDFSAGRDLYQAADPEKILDARGDAVLLKLIKDWDVAKSEARRHKDDAENMGDEIISRIADHALVLLPEGRELTAKTQHRKGYTSVVKETSFRVLKLR